MGCSGSISANCSYPDALKACDLKERMELVVKVPLFQRLPEDKHEKLAKGLEELNYRPGDAVIQQGDHGSDLFIISKGEVQVIRNGAKVAKLGAGDFIGENTLVRNEPWKATFVAVTPLTCLKMTGDSFQMACNAETGLAAWNNHSSAFGEKECVVCLNATIAVELLPCMHHALCVECADKLHRCPLCRVVIQQRVRTYVDNPLGPQNNDDSYSTVVDDAYAVAAASNDVGGVVVRCLSDTSIERNCSSLPPVMARRHTVHDSSLGGFNAMMNTGPF